MKVGELQAYRYQDLRPEGSDGRLTLYVTPTTEGVATVARSSPGSASGFLRSCETWLQDLLINGEAFPLGTDEKYVGRLDETIDRLNADRSRGVKKLRTAKKQSAARPRPRSRLRPPQAGRGVARGLTVSPAVCDASESVLAAPRRAKRFHGRPQPRRAVIGNRLTRRPARTGPG